MYEEDEDDDDGDERTTSKPAMVVYVMRRVFGLSYVNKLLLGKFSVTF